MSFLGRASPTSVFPTYLLPSVPFRRRKSSADSTTSSDSDFSGQSPEAATHRPSDPYLQGHKSHLRCARCATDLCLTSQIISKGFTGRHGRAYLVSASPVASGMSPTTTAMDILSLPNTHTLKAVPRQLVTGAHTVSDVSCAFCGQVLGWKYVAAEEESQRYKVGKFILETKKIYSSSCWENEAADQSGGDGGVEIPPSRAQHRGLARVKEEAVEFDSQDEDECEDLFAGVWSPTLAAKRRQGRRFGRDVAEGVKNGGGR
ncbi:Yippee/Mis18 [Lasallia pustulata]|uniref:Yippee/Mis18 n=1 Tax=Lasallia pustulata TaxID=136370 RepID=A0A1W5CX58_9LECA|nr:Yippee/Mis18 [Lasallia pustulata]